MANYSDEGSSKKGLKKKKRSGKKKYAGPNINKIVDEGWKKGWKKGGYSDKQGTTKSPAAERLQPQESSPKKVEPATKTPVKPTQTKPLQKDSDARPDEKPRDERPREESTTVAKGKESVTDVLKNIVKGKP